MKDEWWLYSKDSALNWQKDAEKQFLADLSKGVLKWSTPLDPGVWDTSAFTAEIFPDLFELPSIPPQNPATILATMKKEWNL
jgi:hypothetical protein